MRLKSVTFGGDLSIVSHRNWQKVVLNIRIGHASLRADEGRAFKLVGCAKAFFSEEPLRADQCLGKKVPVFVERIGSLDAICT